MKQTSTIARTFYKKCLVLILAIFSFSFSQTVLGHSVDSYSGTCVSGPQYKVTAVVSNVNNTSNYRWQWKNSSNAWVCFVNGANVINGISYNVSGAVYNLTTNPGPIIFTNPGSGLQGLQIRMVISDGNGVNPCTLPAGNTWTSASPFTINVANTACSPCTGRVNSLYFNELNGGADLPITNGATFSITQLGSLYNMEAGTSGTVGSVKYTITGPTPSSNTENSAPYNSPGTGSGPWTGAAGSYSVNLKTYSGADATGTLCHDTTITFIISTTLSLGNRVWYDTNNDGLDNNSENGIRGVTVKLYRDNNNDNVADGASIATTTTDVDGYYAFTSLTAGNYIVGATIPAGYMSSSVNGGDPDNNINADDNGQVAAGTEVRGLGITLTSGAEPTGGNTNNTYDFGMLPDCGCTNSSANKLVNASFENGTTGWSWSSANGTLTTGTGYVACGTKNGFNDQSSGTSRVWQDVTVSAGATVNFSAFAGTHAPGIACSPKLSLIFLNSANAVISQLDVTVTRVVGDYHDQLEQYSLSGVAPAGTVKVRVQSSITCNTMKLDAFCLTVSATGSIGDFVWQDNNRNGLQDAGEPGIGGVTVTLSGAASATTTTAANGSYHFNNLAAGTYNVTFATPTAPGNPFVATTANAGSNDAIDSDPVGGVVSGIVLAAGETKNTIDAGFYRQINISGNVWNDANGLTDLQINHTGTQALPNSLVLYLVDINTNQIVQSESVNPDGTYAFLDVNINTSYKVVLTNSVAFPGQPSPAAILPSGWQRVGENLGAGPLSGSDGVPNGNLFIDTETSDIINANFGIRVSSGEVIVG